MQQLTAEQLVNYPQNQREGYAPIGFEETAQPPLLVKSGRFTTEDSMYNGVAKKNGLACGQASNGRITLLLVLWVYSVISWVIGAFVFPTLEINVMPETPFKVFYRRSLGMTLSDLFHKGTYFAACTLSFFSIVVPIMKLLSTLVLVMRLRREPVEVVYGSNKVLIYILSCLSSYQLIDLYVGILFVVHFNSDSADSKFLAGFYWFYSYCMVSMVMMVILDAVFKEDLVFWACSPKKEKEFDDFDFDDEDSDRLEMEPELTLCQEANDEGSRWSEGILGAWILAVCFVVLYMRCFAQPLLEVRTLWSGVAVDRSMHPLREIFVDTLPNQTGFLVAFPLIFMNLVAPILYIVSLLLSCFRWCPRRDRCKSSPAVALTLLADTLRPWATTDVLCCATIVFLFTVHDQKTETKPTQDSNAYYLFLGAGFSMFFLRFLTGSIKKGFCACPGPRFAIILASWLLVCVVVAGGPTNAAAILGISGHHEEESYSQTNRGGLHFEDLDSVCGMLLPLVDDTFARAAPAAYGNCHDANSRPPQPCKGDAPLYEVHKGGNYINLKWLAGVNTMKLDTCRLWKDVPVWNDTSQKMSTRFHLQIGGKFDEVRLYMKARQCARFSWFGCSDFDSDRHCCGEDIRFNFTLGLGCSPSALTGADANAFRTVEVEEFRLDPLIVHADFMGGALHVDAMNIGPKVEQIVTHKMTEFLESTHVHWAHKAMHIPGLLNHLIAYNSPDRAGSC